MLVRFSIDPHEVVGGGYSADEHERLLRYWLEHRLGLLIDLVGPARKGAPGRVRFAASLKTIKNPNVREMWLTSWKKGRDIGIVHAIPEKELDLVDYDSVAVETLSPYIDLLVAGDTDPNRFSDHRFVIESDGRAFLESTGDAHEKIEVVNLKRFDFSDKTRQVQQMRLNGSIPASSKIQDVWNERIRDYFNAPGSKNIHVVDRYCLLRQSNTGLDAFIRMAKKENPEKSKILHIYASMPSSEFDDTARELFNRVQLILRKHSATPYPLREVNVHLIDAGRYGRITADRWIRFGEWIVVAMGHGLEVFQGTGLVERATTCSVHTDIKSTQEIEKSLKYAASESVVIDRNLIKQLN